MGNICTNTLRASGTKQQLDALIFTLRDIYDPELLIMDLDDSNPMQTYCELGFYSSSTFLEDLFRKFTGSLTDKDNLFIRVLSDEPATRYCRQSIYEHGTWDFENSLSVNSQIHALTTQGIAQIKKHIQEIGNIDFGNNCNWCVLYVNDDGYAELAYFRRIELELNGKICLLLSDGVWLYEEDLTTTHIMDILSLIQENDDKKERNNP
ncbi:MAG: hypothetical protein LBT43_07425 [Prevotella sp.]|jgi:hypothetical protein|nr:hypothetical protein [Prevotella sp.]